MRVFMVQGSIIGVVGVGLGVVGGVLLSENLGHIVKFIERLTGSELMPADVYYISGVPTAMPVAAALVLDYLKHPDLRHFLAERCRDWGVPCVSTGRKIPVEGLITPPT